MQLSSRSPIPVGFSLFILFGCSGPPEANDELADDVSLEGMSLTARDCATPKMCRQLRQAAAASAKYHAVSRALADGFVKMSECEVSPPSVSPPGAMGYHYVHPGRMMSGKQSITEPTALLYVPTESGHLRLAGIEHIKVILGPDGKPYMGCGVNDQSCPPPNPPPAPILYDGHKYVGPMAGHVAGMPWHHDEHVWIWSPHPAGIFQPWNPGINCQFAARLSATHAQHH